MALTDKRKIFADEYLVDLNATRAYMVAYKRVKNKDVASAAGSRLLKDESVAAYIDEQMQEIHSKKIADVQEVMEYLTAVLRGESSGEEIVVEGTGDGYSRAKTMEKGPSEKERLKAAELLGKRYALFSEKVEVSGNLECEKTKLDDLISQLRGDKNE